MAMTLRPDEQLAEALRKQAEAEGRSQSAVVLDAVREYVERRARTARLDDIAERVASRHSGLLRRLGEA
jgi:predicted transcriptional regulator